jgi:sirohydrochlorin ferrochelatase
MRHQPLIPLLAVAHGSRDPRAAATVEELLDLVRRSSGLRVATSYLDHAAPTPAQALGALDPADAVVVLPLLLTAAYHSKIDIPRAFGNPENQTHNLLRLRPHQFNTGAPGPHGATLRSADGAPGPHAPALRIGGTLGPHPLLTEALERRLSEAGVEIGDPETAVVIVAAGSSDQGANATIASMAHEWRRRGWFGAVAAFASAASPPPAEAVRALRSAGAPRVVVASYFLAPGYFADKVRTEALEAGATAVSEVLGDAPEIAKLITLRYTEALDLPARAAAG